VSSLMALPQTIFQLVLSGKDQFLVPYCLLICINDLMDLNLPEGSSFVLYADDILLYQPAILTCLMLTTFMTGSFATSFNVKSVS